MRLTNLGTLACCPKQGLQSSFPTAYLKPLPLWQRIVSQGKINSPLRFQGVATFAGKGRVESSRPDHSLRAAGLHPQSGSSVVSCFPEQATSLSTSGLEAESERNLKAEVVLLVGLVGNCLGVTGRAVGRSCRCPHSLPYQRPLMYLAWTRLQQIPYKLHNALR